VLENRGVLVDFLNFTFFIQIDKEKLKASQILLCFSAYANLAKIFKTTNSGDQLGCLNGIRFFTLGW
jgi:hypothetical protein